MKKIVFVLVVLMLATPLMAADVLINCTQPVVGEPNVVVSYVDEYSPGNRVRAFALDIVVEGQKQDGSPATISAVECLSADYYVYPGSVEVTGNEVLPGDEGSCLCDSGDHADTLGGIDSNGVTVEMASLYDENDVAHPTAPPATGDLVKLTIDGCGAITVSISANEIRGKVVLEDATSVDPCAPGCVLAGLPECDPNLGTCWDIVNECGGQGHGDATCDGNVNFADLFALKDSVFKNCGDVGYNCCADFDHSCAVNFADLFILKANVFTSGWAPATLELSCPPLP